MKLGIKVFILITLISFLFFPASPQAADFLGGLLKKGVPQLPVSSDRQLRPGAQGVDDKTVASGLREALAVGTKNAVGLVSQLNGYYGNEAIKILLPDKIQQAAALLGKLGYQRQVDELVLSMNRAAEKAAPKAAPFFTAALAEMSIEDARKILAGDNRSATAYFQSRTSSKIYDEFKPVIEGAMSETGVARAYQAMLDKIPALALVKPQAVDLDHHVTRKALEGLFFMVGEEEAKIRTNPVARTTDLLKKVFSR